MLSLSNFNPDLIVDQNNDLCEHSSSWKPKSHGVNVSLFVPCNWEELSTSSSSSVFKFGKRDESTRVAIQVLLDLIDLPRKMSSIQAKQLLTENGLKQLSEGSGELVHTKPLLVNKVQGGQIIRKDEPLRSITSYKVRNYFIYKEKIVSIAYLLITPSDLDVSNHFSFCDSLLMRTLFK